MPQTDSLVSGKVADLPTKQPLRLPVLAFATQGSGGDDEARLRALLADVPTDFLPFDKRSRKGCFLEILKQARKQRHSLFAMEGTGTAGGLALILARRLFGTRYVVSSGDAVEPFLSARYRAAKMLFQLYESMLYRNASGFIGWTPYLAGRALTMGCPRAMTAAGWAPYLYDARRLAASRSRIRKSFGIPEDAVVFGMAGSLAWSKRYGYCYGHELVRAAANCGGKAYVLIVGDGEGRAILREMAGSLLDRTVFLPGRVSREEVPDYLAAMDIGSLPQSVDGVGSFRYTTKISEYFALRLPYVTNRIPAGYDLDYGGLWRLPGKAPWDPRFTDALSELMETVTPATAAQKRDRIPAYLPEFDQVLQRTRTTAFLQDLMDE